MQLRKIAYRMDVGRKTKSNRPNFPAACRQSKPCTCNLHNQTRRWIDCESCATYTQPSGLPEHRKMCDKATGWFVQKKARWIGAPRLSALPSANCHIVRPKAVRVRTGQNVPQNRAEALLILLERKLIRRTVVSWSDLTWRI